jgi:hypothetical protein
VDNNYESKNKLDLTYYNVYRILRNLFVHNEFYLSKLEYSINTIKVLNYSLILLENLEESLNLSYEEFLSLIDENIAKFYDISDDRAYFEKVLVN